MLPVGMYLSYSLQSGPFPAGRIIVRVCDQLLGSTAWFAPSAVVTRVRDSFVLGEWIRPQPAPHRSCHRSQLRLIGTDSAVLTPTLQAGVASVPRRNQFAPRFSKKRFRPESPGPLTWPSSSARTNTGRNRYYARVSPGCQPVSAGSRSSRMMRVESAFSSAAARETSVSDV